MEGALSRLRSWKLDHKREDVRGWPLRDAGGNLLGTVRELIVDTDSKHVTHVLLEDGRRYDAHDLEIGNRALFLGGQTRPAPARAAGEARAAAPVGETRGSSVGRAGESLRAGTRGVSSGAGETTDLVIPLVDEQLEIGKRVVQTGGVRVRSRLVQRPFHEQVRLVEEQVEVERHRLDRPLAADEAEALLRDREFEVPARSERLMKQKRAQVVEEIVLKKYAEDRHSTIRETVRSTEAQVMNGAGYTGRRTGEGAKS